jgi:hypothetical protein
MRDGIKNWLVVFGIIIVSGTIVYFAVPQKKGNEEDVLGVQSVKLRNAPYITSVAPISIELNKELEYEITVSDLDTNDNDVSIFLTEKPMWMYLDKNVVRGVPNVVGTYKFVVSVSDGVNSTSQINYIVVEDNE